MIDRIDVKIGGGLDVPLPSMARVRQTFESDRVADVAAAVAAEFGKPGVGDKIKPGQKIAVGAGSRGVANVGAAVAAVVAQIKARGGEPFVFPAMGSHGGATVEGQTATLAGYGITEQGVGAPIRATMDTVVLGEMADGTPVHTDRFAHEADGVVVVNRIKPHTSFRGPVESGLLKMIAIGMGKIEGAAIIHTHGMDVFGEFIPRVGSFILERMPILFGLGLVENGYDETAIVEAIPAAQLQKREPELQTEAKRLMARIYFDDIDVLVIQEMGKEISGAGFDPNITGRQHRWLPWVELPRVKKIVVLELTEKTKGNATGLGLADVITMKLFKKIDFPATYANVITSAFLDGAAIPLIMNTEREAIQLAVKTTLRVKPGDHRVVRIANTLDLGEILVSEPMLEEVRAHPKMEIVGAPAPFLFDAQGNLAAA